MGCRSAPLNAFGRRLIVHRVRVERMPGTPVAKTMGVSRTCAHKWLARLDAEGDAGLEDSSHSTRRRGSGYVSSPNVSCNAATTRRASSTLPSSR